MAASRFYGDDDDDDDDAAFMSWIRFLCFLVFSFFWTLVLWGPWALGPLGFGPLGLWGPLGFGHLGLWAPWAPRGLGPQYRAI